MFLQFSDRIIDGIWANQGQFPSQVSIVSRSPQSGRTNLCSGSVIAKDWVLTSATCVLESNQYELRFVSVNFYTGGTTSTSRVGYPHPDYDLYTQQFNLGLIQSTTFGVTVLQLLPLNAGLVLTGRQSIVTGWGFNNGEISPVLQYERGTILDSEDPKCKYNFNNATVGFIGRLCATFSRQYECVGDSGSPLLIQANRISYLVGVASFNSTRNGECKRSTSLFAGLTPVAREWIVEITGIKP